MPKRPGEAGEQAQAHARAEKGTRRGLRGMLLPALLSVALHATPLAVLFFMANLPLLTDPLPIEIREAHPLAQTAPQPPPEPDKPKKRPSAPGKRGSGGKKGGGRGAPSAEPKLPPEPPPPPATTDLRRLAPGESSRIVLMLRADRLRSSPYRETIEALISVLPDYQTFLGGTDLTLMGNFDAILLATANPYDVTATFLAARHADDAHVREVLSQRTLPSWDPRTVRFVEPTLSVLARPEAAERLDRGADGPDGGAEADDGSAAWLGELRHFERPADETGAPALLATVGGLQAVARLRGSIPTPLDASLAATAEASPAVRLTLHFADAKTAEQFVAVWPEILQRWRLATTFLGLSAAFDGLKIEAKEEVVEVQGRISEAHFRLGLNLAQAAVRRATRTIVDAGAPPAAPASPDAARPPEAAPSGSVAPPSGSVAPPSGSVAPPPSEPAAAPPATSPPDAVDAGAR